MAKVPYIQHRYVVKNITNFPAPLHGNRVQIWSVCDKLMERVHEDGIPCISSVYVTREQARTTAKALNNSWKSMLTNSKNKKNKLVK